MQYAGDKNVNVSILYSVKENITQQNVYKNNNIQHFATLF